MHDKRKAVDVVYMEYSDAFDNVPLNRLIQNLKTRWLTVIWCYECRISLLTEDKEL